VRQNAFWSRGQRALKKDPHALQFFICNFGLQPKPIESAFPSGCLLPEIINRPKGVPQAREVGEMRARVLFQIEEFIAWRNCLSVTIKFKQKW
jgi:hypothetical protein